MYKTVVSFIQACLIYRTTQIYNVHVVSKVSGGQCAHITRSY